LPTVTMVLLVVILLTVAITLRSFDRANNARNVRVNQQVLAAATPAIDRAKAKIQFVLEQTQGRGTPSDRDLYFPIANPIAGSDSYTFGDEERLIIKYDLNDDKKIDPNLGVNALGFIVEKNESINTAWRYPVDTNNDGNFDTFTLYGIFFRTPARDDDPKSPTLGDFLRERKPLEARTPPLSVGGLKPGCKQGGGTVASLAGDSGWYRIDGKLKKSFFVYTVNVPMTKEDAATNPKYKEFTGTSSISALEYQQDQALIPLANNAVVYENDLDISPGPPINLNGRVFTNSNLLVSGLNNPNSIKLYQVSSPDSCYYEQENSKIVVSGNVVNGWAGNNAPKNPVDIHLFKKSSLPGSGRTSFILGQKAEIKQPTGESATNPSLDVLYNDQAYTERLSLLVAAQMGQPLPGTGLADPDVQPGDPFSVQRKPETQTREQALREYFKQMLRKVPFAEVPLGGDATAGYGLAWSIPAGTPPILGSKDTLRPVDEWSILDPAKTKIQLIADQLEAVDPLKESEEERFLGDRVVVGNNLPAIRWDATKLELTKKPEILSGQKWNKTDPVDPNSPRTRSSQVTKLADLGATERGGFWEGAAAEKPKNPLDGVGGLRVITSAGVYERKNSFLPPPSWLNSAGNPVTGDTDTYDDPTTTSTTEKFPVVWPDSMPMSPLGLGSEVYNNSGGGLFTATNWTKWQSSWSTTLPSATLPSIDPNTRQYAKGDLRMRATAVYHYADNGYDPIALAPGTEPDQTPIACVSSYYDPSTASTARNISTLPADKSGDISLGTPDNQIGSNNGITYGPPGGARPAASTRNTTTGLLSGGDPVLEAQANLVFPDGRFANEPLRKALLLAEEKRTLGDKAAIDSTKCALQILKGEIVPDDTIVPHGAIQEVAFLNAREIKAIDRDDLGTKVNEAFTLTSVTTANEAAQLTGNYNLPLEERQPLEIRATQIDLDVLRRTKLGTDEYLLPNSGIIYATRDDALPDRSHRPAIVGGGLDESTSATVSPTDSLLDPTRKPNGILLVNGEKLSRDPGKSTTVADVVKEKGLTLASNLPVYIKGTFNPHSGEEFTEAVGDWSTFYDRKNLNSNFGCRPKDPRLNGKCTTGDSWRPANILSDSVNFLSANYRFGFRNEGDFDLRNNAGAAAVLPRKEQGFYSNNFVTNGLSSGAFNATSGQLVNTGGTALTDNNYAENSNPVNSSYFNNFVTPVQRRGNFPEYVMEVCNKIPVYACTEDDWFVNPLAGAPGKATSTVTQDYISPDPANPLTTTFQAGSTVDPPLPQLQRFPRRVAFSRVPGVELESTTAPEPLGINGGKVVKGAGTPKENSLWFATTAVPGGSTVTYDSNFPYVFNQALKDGTGADLPELSKVPGPGKGTQPLLMPVLNLQNVTKATAGDPRGVDIVNNTGWIPKAVSTTFNMVLASNDTPSRAMGNGIGDFNGGMQNLPRFLESWNSGTIATKIQGSFIQFGRSAYSTAPYIPILDPGAPQQTDSTKLRSLFDSPPSNPSNPDAPQPYYRTDNGSFEINGQRQGRIPFFSPPARDWGYDVGLLSQPPDLFTRKFTTPPSKRTPDEYFREVSGNDIWVQTLLCAFIDDATGKTPAINISNKLRPTDSFCKTYAGQ